MEEKTIAFNLVGLHRLIINLSIHHLLWWLYHLILQVQLEYTNDAIVQGATNVNTTITLVCHFELMLSLWEVLKQLPGLRL